MKEEMGEEETTTTMDRPAAVVAAPTTNNNNINNKRVSSSSYASKKELQASNLAIAYVARNPDGSFTQFKIHTTEIKAVWTTVVAETQSNGNAITDLRLAPLEEWEDPARRKRVIFARGVPVKPNECLGKCLQQQSIENPVLLVCWERVPQQQQHQNNNNNSRRTSSSSSSSCNNNNNNYYNNRHNNNNNIKQWNYFLFSNGTDTATHRGGPVVIVTSASGTQQLDEEGIQSVASSAFINWITKKAKEERWEIISLTNLSASARVRM